MHEKVIGVFFWIFYVTKFSIMKVNSGIMVKHRAEITKRGKWKELAMPNVKDKISKGKM